MSVRFKSCGLGLIVKKGINVNKPKWVTVGCNVVLDSYSQLFLNQITTGIKPQLIIGNNVLIGRFCQIGCSNKIIIEDNVLFAPHVHITDRDHNYEDISKPISIQPAYSSGEVVIGKETWIGFGAQIMAGVKVGKHCVIAAGCIVTKNVPDYSVVAGIPAKIVKQYNENTQKWEKIKPTTIS